MGGILSDQPWNQRMLATIVQRVGGGYVFIHRLLLEHFAKADLEKMPE